MARTRRKYGNPEVNKAMLVLQAEDGAEYIKDTAAHAGTYRKIQAVTAAVAALVAEDIVGDLSAVAIPAGVEIRGRFTSVTLASGTVLAYY